MYRDVTEVNKRTLFSNMQLFLTIKEYHANLYME